MAENSSSSVASVAIVVIILLAIFAFYFLFARGVHAKHDINIDIKGPSQDMPINKRGGGEVSKKVPVRRRKIAEDYAKNVRVELAKQTRQEDPRTMRVRGKAAGAHDHGPEQQNKNKKP